MNKLLLTVLFALSCVTYSEELPQKTQSILERLSEWEGKEKRIFDAKVLKKRKEVAKVLEAHLRESTTKGDLDSALVIKKAIENLGIEEVKIAEVDESDDDLAEILIASEWIREDREEDPVIFFEAQTVSIKGGSQVWHVKTDDEGKEKAEILWGGGKAPHPIEFDRSHRRFTLIDHWGKAIGIYKAKKK